MLPMPTFHLPERDPDDNSMSVERFEEISEAERKGEPLELSPEEQAEYEQAKQDWAETHERLRSMVSNAVRPLNPLNDWAKSLQSKLADSLEQQREQLEHVTRPEPVSNPYESLTESIRESQEEQERVEAELAQAAAERVQREIVQTTALQSLVEHSNSQKESLESLVKDSKGQGKINKALVWIGGATLAVSAVAAILAGIALTGSNQPAEVTTPPQTVTKSP